MKSYLAYAASAALLAGCYDSHAVLGGPLRDGGPGPSDGGGPAPGFDGGPSPRDGGPLPPMDSGPSPIDAAPGVDAGPPPDAGPRPDAGPPPDAGPRPDAGRPSRALRFESGDLVAVAHAPTLDLTSTYTFELWIRPGETGNGSISAKGERASRRFQYGVAIDGDEIVVGFASVGTAAELRAPIVRTVWTHVATIVSSPDPMTVRIRLLLDGVIVADGIFPNVLPDAVNDLPLLLGGGGYRGDVDEVRLWRFARAPDGIRASMRTRISGALPGLEAYWALEEGGQLALDRTSHGHEGVLGRLTTPDPDDPRWILDGPI